MVAPALTPVTPSPDSCAHDWRYAGKATPSDDCERPSRMFCLLCRLDQPVRCSATSRAKCAPCSERHRRRVATLARGGMTFPGRRGRLLFVTLTAPGQDVLPWDRSVCSHGAGVKCSGPLGCRVQAFEAARWNAAAPRMWDHFRRDLARVLDVSKIEAFGTWERHQRGVLHRHSVLVIPHGVGERRFLAAVRLTARRQGFGKQLDVQSARAGAEWYLAKYASKSVDEIPEMRYVDEYGEIIFGARYRPWSMSRGWWLSMSALKASQVAYWRAGGGSADSAEHGRWADPGDGAAGALDTYSATSASGPEWADSCPFDEFFVIV